MDWTKCLPEFDRNHQKQTSSGAFGKQMMASISKAFDRTFYTLPSWHSSNEQILIEYKENHLTLSNNIFSNSINNSALWILSRSELSTQETSWIPNGSVPDFGQYFTPNQHVCKKVELILYGYICGLCCILGIMGNLYGGVLIGRSSKLSSSMLFLLRSISLADSITLLLWLVVKTSLILIWDATQGIDFDLYNISTVLNYSLFPLMAISRQISNWLTVTVSLHRYLAVRFPLKVSLFICFASKSS